MAKSAGSRLSCARQALDIVNTENLKMRHLLNLQKKCTFLAPSLGVSGSAVRRPAFSFRSSGFSLVEVTLAVGIAGFCLLAIVGMLPVGLSNNKNSINQSAAANLARSIVADLRAAKITGSSNQSPQYALVFSTPTAQTTYFGEDGTQMSSPAAGGYRSTTTIDTSKIPVPVKIKITWPAAASEASASEAFEITTALDR